MKNGWIKIYRKVLDNPILKKPYNRALWLTLLLMANHKEEKIYWNGEILIIKEGQILTGRDQLVKETGIPSTTIERILKILENGHQIGQQKTTKFRLITIINWKEYQNLDSKVDNKRTTNGQQTDTNKNDKNDKKDISKDISIAKNTNHLLEEFYIINPTLNFANTTQRRVLEEMENKFGYEKLLNTIRYAVSVHGQQYAPVITTPLELKNKMGQLMAYYKKENNSQIANI